MTGGYCSLVGTVPATVRDDTDMDLDGEEIFRSSGHFPGAGVSQSTGDQDQRGGAQGPQRIGSSGNDIQRRPVRRNRSAPSGPSGGVLQESRGYGPLHATEPIRIGPEQDQGRCREAAVGVGGMLPTIYAAESGSGASAACVRPVSEECQQGALSPGTSSEGAAAAFRFSAGHSSRTREKEGSPVGQLCGDSRYSGSAAVGGQSWYCRPRITTEPRLGDATQQNHNRGKEGKLSAGKEDLTEVKERRDTAMWELQFPIVSGPSQIPREGSPGGIWRSGSPPLGEKAGTKGENLDTNSGLGLCGLEGQDRRRESGKTARAGIEDLPASGGRSCGWPLLPAPLKQVPQLVGLNPVLTNRHDQGEWCTLGSSCTSGNVMKPLAQPLTVLPGMCGFVSVDATANTSSVGRSPDETLQDHTRSIQRLLLRGAHFRKPNATTGGRTIWLSA
jgi:hypothetical protein